MREVQCSLKKEVLPGLIDAPFHGPSSDLVFENVSQAAWDEWLEMQIKIINEYKLDLGERGHRDRLRSQMLSFLGLSDEESTLEVGTPTT